MNAVKGGDVIKKAIKLGWFVEDEPGLIQLRIKTLQNILDGKLILDEAELRQMLETGEGDGVYCVRYSQLVPKLGGTILTVYINIKKLLGER